VLVTGVVARDRSEAWYVVATVAATATQHAAPLRLTGLDPDRRYRVTEEMPRGPGGADLAGAWAADGTESSGRVLATVGVALPVLNPEEARVLRLVARA
jgi:alpha-galactosidase